MSEDSTIYRAQVPLTPQQTGRERLIRLIAWSSIARQARANGDLAGQIRYDGVDEGPDGARLAAYVADARPKRDP